jgi:hypothetical protein
VYTAAQKQKINNQMGSFLMQSLRKNRYKTKVERLAFSRKKDGVILCAK